MDNKAFLRFFNFKMNIFKLYCIYAFMYVSVFKTGNIFILRFAMDVISLY